MQCRKCCACWTAIVQVNGTLPRPVPAAHSTKMGSTRYLRTQQTTKNLFVLLVLLFAKVECFEMHVRPVVCGAHTGIACNWASHSQRLMEHTISSESSFDSIHGCIPVCVVSRKRTIRLPYECVHSPYVPGDLIRVAQYACTLLHAHVR
jgi:hypothetical protein